MTTAAARMPNAIQPHWVDDGSSEVWFEEAAAAPTAAAPAGEMPPDSHA